MTPSPSQNQGSGAERRARLREQMATMEVVGVAPRRNGLDLEDLACLVELPATDPEEKTRQLVVIRERLHRR
ncbi:MAG: hypothetical protein H6747_08020 [Deltaproteobacteria bacterium]|nr:hypothetical protein [Deltaproteobacteria bacterium]